MWIWTSRAVSGTVLGCVRKSTYYGLPCIEDFMLAGTLIPNEDHLCEILGIRSCVVE